MVYKIELLKKNRYLLAKYRQKSQIAISNLQNIMSNPNDILSLDNIMDKYQYISKCIGLYIDGVSCYGYFVPLNADEYFLLRLSNHNNTNGELYDEHEKDGRPNKRFIIYFIGNDYKASQPNMFQESEHRVINYPVTSLDTEKGVISFCSQLIHLFNKGNAEFGSLESAYNVGQFYKNGNLKGIVAQIDDNGQITLLVDCLNIKDKSIANKKVLKQYGQFVYPFYRTKAYDSSNWRLPTESEGKILLTNYNEINQNIQNIGGKVELIPNKIWAQNNSFIDFEHNQIGISQNDNDCCAIRRVMTIYPNSNVSENNQYKYNRNNMKKKLIRLTEADLHRIVNRSVDTILNEAYGTPDKGTMNAINNIRTLEIGENDYHSLNSIYKRLFDARNSVDEWTTSVETMDSDGICSRNSGLSRKYSEYLVKQIDAAICTCKILMNKRVMNQGEQPDDDYFNR